ncbi:MAG: hypothetical protein Q7V17_13855 [Afipia sp.]|nr:hypothetical protein [Afipia sp.]
MRLRAHSAEEDEVRLTQTFTSDPCLDGHPGLFVDLELNGSAGFLLGDFGDPRRCGFVSAVRRQIRNADPDFERAGSRT